MQGHVDVCACLEVGMTTQCGSGYSPMHYALQAGHMRVAEWLLLHGAMRESDSAVIHAVFLEIAHAPGAYERLMAFAVLQYHRLTRRRPVDQSGHYTVDERLSHLRQFLLYLETGN